jgi:hypothetical protein
MQRTPWMTSISRTSFENFPRFVKPADETQQNDHQMYFKPVASIYWEHFAL